MEWEQGNPEEQRALSADPYDRWVSPEGVCMAEFYRLSSFVSGDGYLVRFPGQADFELSGFSGTNKVKITATPVPGCDPQTLSNLYNNAIVPILGNHSGGLFLHGSAVCVADDISEEQPGAIAFLGLSRGGKTTLAGAFAKDGNPFLTEDVIDLSLAEGQYWLQPKRSRLRLFADSARHLLGQSTAIADENRKQDVEAGQTLPFAERPVVLRQIYVLGTDHAAPLSIRKFSLPQALTALMPHAFILDVEDKQRLRGHFSRMADLSQDIGCYALDYTRNYEELPKVQAAILANYRNHVLEDDRRKCS